MDILAHDLSVVGSFLTDIPKCRVEIELSEPKNAKALLLVSSFKETLYFEAGSRQVFSLVLDTNFFAFLSELVEQKQLCLAYPFLIEKATLLIKNSKSIPVSAQFYLIVIGEELSEMFEVCARKVKLERNL